MSAVFEVSLDEINENSSPDSIVSWDSLSLMNLVVSIEEEFNIQLDDDEIVDMLNFRLIKEIISSKIE
jgi:acyl carrier protein